MKRSDAFPSEKPAAIQNADIGHKSNLRTPGLSDSPAAAGEEAWHTLLHVAPLNLPLTHFIKNGPKKF